MGLKAKVMSGGGSKGSFSGEPGLPPLRPSPKMTNPCREIPLGQHEMARPEPDTYNEAEWTLGPWEDIEP